MWKMLKMIVKSNIYFFFLELSVSIFYFMCLISRALLTCFVLRFVFVLPSLIDVSFTSCIL